MKLREWEFSDLANLLIVQNNKYNEVYVRTIGLEEEQSGYKSPLGVQGKHTGVNSIIAHSLFKTHGSPPYGGGNFKGPGSGLSNPPTYHFASTL